MEPVRDYELKAFFNYVVDVLEYLDIPYMVIGGFAAIVHGEPRLTLDVDIVVDMKPEQIAAFVSAFPVPDFYISEEGMRDALQRRYPFNVIQPATGAKVDLVPLPSDPFTQAAFQRRQELPYDVAGHSAVFITPEDIVLAKLIALRETGSQKHQRDARGVLITQWGRLDVEALHHRARAAGVLSQFEEILAAARQQVEGS